jgi:uncharacterized protein YjaZ
MSVTLINAMIIQGQGDNIVCEVYGQSRETGKWAGAINLYKKGFFHRTLISSDHIFDTKEEAVIYMEDVVKKVRLINLKPQTKKVEQIIGSETMKVTKQIVSAAN